MSDLTNLYEEAIKVCEEWRTKKVLHKATPNEIHLYNVFTNTKNQLSQHLGCIKDAQGTYMKDKNE